MGKSGPAKHLQAAVLGNASPKILANRWLRLLGKKFIIIIEADRESHNWGWTNSLEGRRDMVQNGYAENNDFSDIESDRIVRSPGAGGR